MKRFLIAPLLALSLAAGAANAAPKAGEAPRFVGQTLDGQALDLAALRGHVVVVDLWATWCPPCRVEMPILDSFYQARHGQGVEVVGLSADQKRDAKSAVRVMAAYHFPAALLVQAKTNDFGQPSALPQTFVLDRQGRVSAVFGAQGKTFSRAELDAAVDAAARS